MAGIDSAAVVPSFLELLGNSAEGLPQERREVKKPAPAVPEEEKGNIKSMKMAQLVLDETMLKLTRVGDFLDRHDESGTYRQLEEANKKIQTLKTENKKLINEKDLVEKELAMIQGRDPYDFSSRSTQELRELHDQFERSREQIKKLLDDRGRRLEDLTMCVVCNEKDRAVMLQPCTHLALCSECAAKCSICPMCRAPITDRVEVKVS